MTIGPGRRWVHTRVAAATALFLLGLSSGATAQGRTSAPLTVSVTVVQTCTVEDVNVPDLPGTGSPTTRTSPAPGPSYSIRCGKQRLTYPAAPGSAAAPLSKGAPVRVARTPDGRTFVVQF